MNKANNSHIVSGCVNQETWDNINKLAEQEKRSRSDIIRRIISVGLKHWEQTNPKAEA